jgi:hypothetical protein
VIQGPSRSPSTAGECTPVRRLSQALKTQDVVVSCLAQPLHLEPGRGSVEIRPEPVHALWTVVPPRSERPGDRPAPGLSVAKRQGTSPRPTPNGTFVRLYRECPGGREGVVAARRGREAGRPGAGVAWPRGGAARRGRAWLSPPGVALAAGRRGAAREPPGVALAAGRGSRRRAWLGLSLSRMG